MEKPFLYLASGSPRRKELLEQIGVAYRLFMPEQNDENAHAALEDLEKTLDGENPADYVQRVTRLKLQAALQRWRVGHRDAGLEAAPILCADTTVALDGRVLGKPADTVQTRAMLAALSGRTHEVLTAVALAVPQPDGRWSEHARLSRSQVRVAALSAQMCDAYVAGGQWRGKAGGYGIQGAAAAWIAHIEGSYSAIMGLPLFEVAKLLREGAGWQI